MNFGNIWVDIREKGFEALGVDKATRDEVQPLVDQAAVLGASYFQTDGYVPPNQQGIGGSTVPFSSIGFMQQKILGMPAWILIALILGLLLIVLMKRK